MATSEYGRLLDLEGDLELRTIDSPALAGNPLGDPSTRFVGVYTPPGYDPEGSTRYPVLYCLHGFTGNVQALIGARPWERNVVQRADRLIREKAMPPVCVAIVDGFTRLGGSQYVDSPHNGDYATYVVRDVIDHIDANFRTIPREGGRAVFGKSSGGFGSFHLIFEHPGIFCAFASHSGDAYFKYCYVPEWAVARRTLEQLGSIEAFLTSFETTNKPPSHYMTTINEVAMAAAYSPAGTKAFAIELPFDLATGEIREDVFARWLRFDPVERVAAGRDALARLRLRYLDCGRKDEFLLDVGARVFARRCRDLGLEVVHEEFDDDHRNVGYRYDVSLPLLARVLDRD